MLFRIISTVMALEWASAQVVLTMATGAMEITATVDMDTIHTVITHTVHTILLVEDMATTHTAVESEDWDGEEMDTETAGTEMELTTMGVCGEVQPEMVKLRMSHIIIADR